MFKKIAFIFLLIGMINSVFGQKEISWLKKNTAKINLDTLQKDDTQFETIKKSIGKSRIVFLGEQTHGDGTTFETKAKLIQYLHQEMGFTILAFESNLFNAERAWQDVQENINPLTALQNSTGQMWGKAKEVQPLFAYILSKKNSDSPLKISGFDCQTHGYYYYKYFPREFVMYLRSKNIGFIDSTERVNFFKVYNILTNGINIYLKGINENSRKLYLDTFFNDKKIFSKILDKKILELSNLNEPKGNLFLQHLISFKNYIPELLDGVTIDSTISNNIKVSAYLRDSLMAENIIWLANKRYPNEKIIIWAASYHNARHKSVGYGNMIETLMGDFLKPELEKISYSIAFTTYEGYFGRWNSKDSVILDKSSLNSFEDLFSRVGKENFFLDFKTLSKTKNGKWLTEPKIMRPLGYREQEKNWTLVFDAVIFNRRMKKVHSVL